MTLASLGYNATYSEVLPTVEELVEQKGDTLLEFGAPWCGHCQEAQPGLREVMAEHPTLIHIKLLDGEGQEPGRAFGVHLWPTLILLHDGREVARLVRPLHVDQLRHLMEILTIHRALADPR